MTISSKADIRKLPWPHMVVRDFLPAEMYQAITSGTPNKVQTYTEDNCIKYNMIYQTDSAYLDVLTHLTDREFITDLYAKFDIEATKQTQMLTCTLVDAQPGFRLGAHTDLKDKPNLNLQIYLSENNLHETVKVHNLDIGSTMCTEVPCQPNLMWCFITSDKTWHTLPIIKTNRVSILCKYGEK